MSKKSYYYPEIISFSSGALVMIFEILGSRIVGPYIGTSLFVWTSLIAVILWALSFGYFFWWKLADKNSSKETLASIFLIVSALIILLFIVKDSFLESISSLIPDIRFSALVVALPLFWPISFLFWLVPPIVTKGALKDLKTWGSTIGRFESIGTIGSICGTLAAGFFLIPFFWVNQLILLLAWISFILSCYTSLKRWWWAKIITVFFLILCVFLSSQIQSILAKNHIFVFDTSYSHITIWERIYKDNRTIRDLKIDNITHAGMYLDSNDLLHEYTKYYHLFSVLNPQAKDILMLWGAAYSFPKSFLRTYQDKNLDVVEIDPEMTKLAKTYFGLWDTPRLTNYHQDARVYLNQTKKKYDAILWDAFGSFYSVPYQLTTREVVQKKFDLLNKNGIVLLNIIWSIEWKNAEFVKAEYKTYTSVFPEVFLIPVRNTKREERQNIILVALKNPENVSYTTENSDYISYLSKRITIPVDTNIPILTDNYAPVDYLVSKMVN
jgi:predicted membrane-bound spermidine synthase